MVAFVRLLQFPSQNFDANPTVAHAGLQPALLAQIHKRWERSHSRLEEGSDPSKTYIAGVADANNILAAIDSGLLSTYQAFGRRVK